MRGVRSVAIVFSVIGWIHLWFFFAEVREVHLVRDVQIPMWMTLLLGVTTTALIGTAVAAWMRMPAWPLMAVGGALAYVLAVVGGQFTLAGEGADVGLIDAFRVAIEGRSAWAVVLVTAIPTVLVLAGISARILENQRPVAGSDRSLEEARGH